MVEKTIALKSFPVCVSRNVGTTTSYHNHKYYEFVYVLEGMVEHIINDEPNVLREGNYFLLSTNDRHVYRPINSEPFKIVNFMFDPSLIDPIFTIETPFNKIIKHPLIGMSDKKFTASPFATQFSDDSKNLLPVFLNALTEYQQKKVGYLNVLRADLIKGIVACMRNVCVDSESSAKIPFVDKITKYVNDNYSENISLSTLCDSLGYTVPYVSRIFKEQIGMSFSEYLVKVRVQKACALMLSTDMSIQQIVNAVGYSNMSFFYRSFKNIMGETPHEFRKN
jgi:AraC-like DNA-binding protein